MLKTKYNQLPFVFFCIIASIAMAVMFTQVGVFHEQVDFSAHNLSAIELYETPISKMSYPLIVGYPLMHTTLKLLGQAVCFLSFGSFSLSFATDIASVALATIFNLLTIILVRFILNNLFPPSNKKILYLYDCISVTSVFIMGICGYLTNFKFYLPQGGPNVWHNPTFIFVRPFGLLTFYLFIKAFEAIKSGKDYKKKLFWFSLVLVISCIAKPNYAFVLLPAMGILTLIELSNNFVHKLKTIGIPLLLSVLPAGIILILQFVYVTGTFASGNVYTIIKFGSQFNMSFWVSIKAIISLLSIPILVFVTFGYKYIKREPAYILSVLTVFIGFLQYYFLYQTGPSHGDYFWGYGLSAHLAIFVSLGLLFKHNANKLLINSSIVIYLFQLYYGLQYFIGILLGQDFIGL